MVQDNKTPLRMLEETLGYRFKNPALLETALTAPSYRADHEPGSPEDNQRLEFLGDAVFGLLTAQHAFERHPEEEEGRLTVRRSRWASGRALAELARRIGLGAHLRLGRADEAAGGRDKDKALTDALEAVFGAAWCDGGLRAASQIFEALAVPDGDEAAEDIWADNPKGRLQEIAQRHAWPDSPQYEPLDVTGPCHEPLYTVRARVAGGYEATATGRTKRAAEAAAAQALLALLKMEKRM